MSVNLYSFSNYTEHETIITGITAETMIDLRKVHVIRSVKNDSEFILKPTNP